MQQKVEKYILKKCNRFSVSFVYMLKGADAVDRYIVNETEFNKKYEQYSPLVFRTAYQYLFNISAAEDITQEVFIKLLTQRKPFNDAEHEKAWLLRVTVNACKNYKTARANSNISFNDEIRLYDNSFEESFETRIDIERELDKLSPEQRLLMYLYYYEHYKIKEIAKITGRKVNTVKSDLKRARDTLKNNVNRE